MNNNLKSAIYNTRGFTLLELLISISIFVLVMLTVYSLFSLGQRAYRRGGEEMEIWQNARTSLDRMTREIRQAENIVTVLPPSETDPLNPPVNELQFQDGHDNTEIIYIRYYLDGTDLMRQRLGYYFPDTPAVYVKWDSLDSFGNPVRLASVYADLAFYVASGK